MTEIVTAIDMTTGETMKAAEDLKTVDKAMMNSDPMPGFRPGILVTG
jgi:hypothetical protein